MNKKTSGFTLAEVMVSMAAASILILASTGLLIFGSRTYQRHALSVRAGEIGDAMSERIRTKLQYAEALVIDEDERAAYEDYQSLGFTRDGDFLLNGKAGYQDHSKTGMAGGCRISLSPADPHIIHLELYLKDQSDNLLYQNREVIKLLNMELDGVVIDCRVAEQDGRIDSSDQTVMFYYLDDSEQNRR